MRVSVFGLGYVGCVMAGCLARDGHTVVGVDVVPEKVECLNAGLPTVVEPGLETLVAEGRRLGRISATLDARAATLATDVSLICVGTPSAPDGSLDLAAVRATAEAIGRALRDKGGRHTVILRSTVPPGTTEGVVGPCLREPGGREIGLVVVPEFLREGCAIADYDDPPFVIAGSPDGRPGADAAVVEALFAGVAGRVPFHWVPTRQAETLKAACNAFHALKVAFANEIGALCPSLGVDGLALMGQLVEDRKLNVSPAYLRPGLPFGGSCLPKDLRMLLNLADQADVELPLLASILPSNDAHTERAVAAIREKGRRRVGLSGLAFKAGTDDLRESPLVRIAESLVSEGFDLKIFEPALETSRLVGSNRDYVEQHLPHLSGRLVADADELLEHAEVLVLTRDEDDLRTRVAQMFRPPLVVDLTAQLRRIPPRRPAPLPAASRP
jgi:GDP-mannose 6-dehydrogenase